VPRAGSSQPAGGVGGTTLPAGGSCTVNYTFSPSLAGYSSDFSDFTISQTSSQSDGEEFNVALYGCGNAC